MSMHAVSPSPHPRSVQRGGGGDNAEPSTARGRAASDLIGVTPNDQVNPATAPPGARSELDCAGGLQSVLAALDLLTCFEDHEEFGVSELARHIGVAKSTAHRLLTSLCARGFAERDAVTGRYRLGLHVYELGHLTVSRNDIRTAALPLLQDLTKRTGATAEIGVPYHQEVLMLKRFIGRGALAAWSEIGCRQPIERTSSGKVLSAYSPSFVGGRLVGPLPIALAADPRGGPPLPTRSSGDPETWLRGSVNEMIPGLTSVAGPVLGHDGVAYAAVSLVGPTAKMLADIQNPARLVQLAARNLARELCL